MRLERYDGADHQPEEPTFNENKKAVLRQRWTAGRRGSTWGRRQAAGGGAALGGSLTTVVVTEGEPVRSCPRASGPSRCPGRDGDHLPHEYPQGALFLVRLPETELPERLEGRRYLVLDGVQDPGNVGTIWRTADALGADGLLLVNSCADPYGPKTVRASMGACFRLPVWETGPEGCVPCWSGPVCRCTPLLCGRIRSHWSRLIWAGVR